VYADAGDSRMYREDDRLGGDNPYASSKAAAELVAATWRRSYFHDGRVAVATARAGNVIGGGDRGEDRLVPDIWRALEAHLPVRLRYPAATRPWQFVLEPVFGYLLLADHLIEAPDSTPKAVNFGPRPSDCVPVATIVETVLALWGHGSWEPEVAQQPPEAMALRLDSSLATTALGWQSRLDLRTALEWTVAWWRVAADGGDLRPLALAQIDTYQELIG
jgi:CDP-glucose 4,6-dehydratase